ncbi:MAG: hypothetical protein ACREEE_17625, partial [Dongiaceae bacterium]
MKRLLNFTMPSAGGTRTMISIGNTCRVLLLVVPALFWSTAPRCEVTIDITNPNIAPLPIAVSDFYGDPTGVQITDVIAADLERSGLFAPIDKAAFIQT